MKRAAVAFVCLAGLALAYRVDWSVTGDGGGTASSSGHSASFTVGQPAVGRLEGTNFLALVGFWQGDAQVAVRENADPGRRGRLANELSTPAPNPFARSTRIQYTVSGPSEVGIAVCDRVGRVVRTLVNGSRPAGRHEVRWNGTDDRDRLVPAGVYFCRMRTDGYGETRKLIVQR
jgi:hypothetical protein